MFSFYFTEYNGNVWSLLKILKNAKKKKKI